MQLWVAIKRLISLKYAKVAPTFVFISLFIWLTSALSEQHSARIPLFLGYIDLDTEQYLENTALQKVDVICSGSGFRLMMARMFPQTLSVSSNNIEQQKESFKLKTSLLAMYVENHFDGTLVMDINSVDAIQTPIRKATKRPLAVRISEPIELQPGYDWTSDFSFTPDTIYAYGPEELVQSLDYAYLKHDLTSPISENLDVIFELKSENEALLNWSQTQVRAQRSLDRFTEYNIRIPIEFLNNDKKLEVQLIPRYTELNLSVPIGLLKNIKPTDFRVVCEYLENDDSNRLPLRVLKSPEQVRILKLNPEEIQFFVRK